MLKDILQFFKEEKLYTALFLVIIGTYAYASFSGIKDTGVGAEIREDHERVLEDFKEREKDYQDKIKSSSSVEDYMRDHPREAMVLQLLSLFILFSIGGGLYLNFHWWFTPAWREKWIEPPPPEPPMQWRFGMLFKVLLLFITGSFLTGIVLAVIYRFLVPQEMEAAQNILLLLHTTFTDVIGIVLIVAIVRSAGGRLADLGFGRGRQLHREILSGLAGYMMVMPYFLTTLIAVLGLAQLFNYEPPAHPLVAVFLEEDSRTPMLIAYSVFFAIVMGPILEEVFFRGFCYPVFKAKWGTKWAMIITSAFFALIHANTFAFVPIFVLGMGLAYLYEKRGSLAAPIVLHVVHNAVFIGYFFLAKDLILHES